jgi:hypothetical protein
MVCLRISHGRYTSYMHRKLMNLPFHYLVNAMLMLQCTIQIHAELSHCTFHLVCLTCTTCRLYIEAGHITISCLTLNLGVQSVIYMLQSLDIL